MPPEIDPHSAYLDTVFARIDRLRHIDVTVLTDRYGIDPAALSPIESETQQSWAVERVLADADAQRTELREHLEGLTREYVVNGLRYKDAVVKAQTALGDPSMLAVQISRSTSQTALGLDGRWLPILARDGVLQGLFHIVPYSVLLVPAFAAGILATLSILAIVCGTAVGYAFAITVTPEIRLLLGRIVDNLKVLDALPRQRRLTPPQRVARLRIRRRLSYLTHVYSATSGVTANRRETYHTFTLEVMGVVVLLAPMWWVLHEYQLATAILSAGLPVSLFTLCRALALHVRSRRAASLRRTS